MRRQAELWVDNWRIWALGFRPRLAWLKKQWREGSPGGVLYALHLLTLYHCVDVGLNTLTGGDPRESISVRVFRHRNVNHVYGLVSKIANALFHDDGPQPLGTHGEFELAAPAQVFLIAWFVALPVALGFWL